MTLIGDPPNVVIGSKLADQIQFVDFLIYNGPLVLVLLPVAVTTQFLRCRHEFPRKVSLDLNKLKREGRIVDERALLFVACWLGFVFLGLLLNPVPSLLRADTAPLAPKVAHSPRFGPQSGALSTFWPQKWRTLHVLAPKVAHSPRFGPKSGALSTLCPAIYSGLVQPLFSP